MAFPLKRGGQIQPDALEDAYERLSGALLTFFARRALDPETALDLTAETFAQVFLSRRRFRGSSQAELDAWIYAIARTQLARFYRQGRAEDRAVKRLGIQLPRLTDDEFARIEELSSIDELRGAIASAMAQISPGQRAALTLRIVDELPYEEVANRLGISEPTARARVSRGLRALTHIMDAHPIPEEQAS